MALPRIGLVVMLLGLPLPAAPQSRPRCKPDEYYRVTQKECVAKAVDPRFYRPSGAPRARKLGLRLDATE